MNTIMHNLSAMNAQRQLSINGKKKVNNTEKLSSGYRINRSADDAAGLSISEKMRTQIRGLNQGAKNTEDGISLCKVADGALAEVTEILHRITELSVQSANGTNTEQERRAIQQEISQLMQEIDRIGETTEFNRKKIFDGNGGQRIRNASSVGGVGQTPGVGGISGTLPKGISIMTHPFHFGNISTDEFFGLSDGIHTITGNMIDNRYPFKWDGWYEDTPPGAPSSNSPYLPFQISYDKNIYSSKEEAAKAIEGKTFYLIPERDYKGISYTTGGSKYLENKVMCERKIQNLLLDYEDLFSYDPKKVFLDVYPRLHYDENHPADLYYEVAGEKGSSVFKLTEASKKSVQELFDTNNGKLPPNLELEFYTDSDPHYKDKYTLSTTGDASFSELIAEMKDQMQTENPLVGFRYQIKTLSFSSNDPMQTIPLPPNPGGTAPSCSGALGRWWIQSGANPGDGLFLEFEEMDTEILGLKGLDASTEWGAGEAITRMAKALKILMSQRTRIGAQQNRLEHIYQNVTNAAENTQNAETRIRDADLAKEMVSYARDHILGQVGEAMLAQTNQSPRQVLSLLQS